MGQRRNKKQPPPSTRASKSTGEKSKSGGGGGSADGAAADGSAAAANRPKNHLITDATSPYTFRFVRYGSPKSITVHQTPDEATWPGGALWDVGVLMARLLVMALSPPPPPSSGEPFVPRVVAPGVWGPRPWRDRRVLELGCGVGLTGLVAGALGARAVLLTDLAEVVEGATRPNAERNAGALGSGGPSGTAGGGVAAAPLRWGDEEDEGAAAAALDALAPPPLAKDGRGGGGRRRRRKKKGAAGGKPPGSPSASAEATEASSSGSASDRSGIPDVVLIGDVAYQHRPGAPSHFDALLSTALKFADERTLLVFGTRMRMPASADLLHMFRERFEEVVDPPVEAHEVDGSFRTDALGRRHNITIHLMRRRRGPSSSEGCGGAIEAAGD